MPIIIQEGDDYADAYACLPIHSSHTWSSGKGGDL